MTWCLRKVCLLLAATGCGCHPCGRDQKPKTIEVAPISVSVDEHVLISPATQPADVASATLPSSRATVVESILAAAIDFRNAQGRWPNDREELAAFAGDDVSTELAKFDRINFDVDARGIVHFTAHAQRLNDNVGEYTRSATFADPMLPATQPTATPP